MMMTMTMMMMTMIICNLVLMHVTCILGLESIVLKLSKHVRCSKAVFYKVVFNKYVFHAFQLKC